jgi:hypothetical protein
VRFEKGNSTPKRVVLKNTLGQEVTREVKSLSDEIEIETTELPRGVYIVVVEFSGRQISKKLIVD